ncbi:hypothetical protein GO730_06655 [Spirosoma sp. HMF3257]|uniref:hypothetical protein n=1 Tax=Spirosoma telluris TaxID=2183553 RepID=UPI0011B944E9|nr:hypothetical protein [Spirosoma telluris]
MPEIRRPHVHCAAVVEARVVRQVNSQAGCPGKGRITARIDSGGTGVELGTGCAGEGRNGSGEVVVAGIVDCARFKQTVCSW